MPALEAAVPPTPPWESILWATAALVVLELSLGRGPHPPLSILPSGTYLAGLAAVTGAVLLVHLGPAFALLGIAGRWPRLRAVLPVLAAALFGFSWQDTALQGDGARSHRLYELFRFGAAAGAPLLLGLFTWLLLLPGRLPWLRRAAVASALAAGIVFDTRSYLAYRAFHGHLALWNSVLALWLAAPLLARPPARWAGRAALVALAAIGIWLGSGWPTAAIHVHQLSRFPGSMLAGLPLGELLVPGPAHAVDPRVELPPSEAGEAGRELAPAPAGPARGDSVLLVVLESTRWDLWADPAVAPRFHRYRRAGVYLPDAIAQYPATPLAYGALFTSQPPSVLAQSPFWGRRRLFDALAPRFRHLLLSRPEGEWFEHTAITEFFLAPGRKVPAHASAEAGLARLRQDLEAMPEGDSFFAWVHLYEPHEPYELREGLPADAGKLERYRAELAYVDEHLGRFLEWFLARPEADRTLVVVLGDHGEGLGETVHGEPFWGHHVHVQNLVSRVPMFVAGPGLPAGAVEPGVGITQLDLMPTLFDFLGVPLPEALLPQGRSVYELLRERPVRSLPTEAFSIRGKAFFEFVSRTADRDPDELAARFARLNEAGTYAPKVALTRGRWKLVFDRMLRRYWLYDQEADPYERQDLAAARPEVLAEMKGRLDAWARRQGWVVRRLRSAR